MELTEQPRAARNVCRPRQQSPPGSTRKRSASAEHGPCMKSPRIIETLVEEAEHKTTYFHLKEDALQKASSGFSDMSKMPTQVPPAQTATSFLRGTEAALKVAADAKMGKHVSGASLAHVSTAASLGEASAYSVAEVWKDCLREVKPRMLAPEQADDHLQGGSPSQSSRWRRRVPEPPPVPRGSPPTPRTLDRMRGQSGAHRRAAPASVEFPCHGRPKFLPCLRKSSPERDEQTLLASPPKVRLHPTCTKARMLIS